jgi:transcriptional regulator with XRE-family HTH domain
MRRLLTPKTGRTLQALRRAFNLSPKELSYRVGVSASLITLFEKGERRPSRKTLDKLSRVFRLPCTVFDLPPRGKDIILSKSKDGRRLSVLVNRLLKTEDNLSQLLRSF